MDFNKLSILKAQGFTSGQSQAIIKIDEFYHSKDLFFLLYGAAGTGKTFLINYVLNTIIKTRVCVTAPTHKAVRVVEKRTGKRGKTIHSLLGLRLNVNLENFNINNPQFDPRAEPTIKNYHILLLDEGSMINDDLTDLLCSIAKSYNTKVLFIGDKRQLPPIGKRVSKVFHLPNYFELTEIVRQKGDNPLLDPLTILCDDIDHQTSNFINFIQKNKDCINDKGEGFRIVKEAEFKKELISAFKSEQVLKNIDYVRFVSFTNDNVRLWNTVIRNGTIEETKDIVHLDDLFTGYTSIFDDFFTPIIINSDDYIVKDIQHRMSDFNFMVYLVTIQSISGFSSTVRIVDHKDKSWINYYQLLNNLHWGAMYATASMRGKKWNEYYKFKNMYLTMVAIPLKDKGIEKPRGTVPKDIDYGYGLTIHKSQGSTYENVFIDMVDVTHYQDRKSMMYNTDKNPYAIEFRNKLLYVALSRASKKATILY